MTDACRKQLKHIAPVESPRWQVITHHSFVLPPSAAASGYSSPQGAGQPTSTSAIIAAVCSRRGQGVVLGGQPRTQRPEA